jgi:FkbM family methyltransferase
MTIKKVLSDLLSTDSGKRHPFRVLSRFAYLQVRKRLSTKPFVFTTCTGTKAYVQAGVDTTGSAGLFYTGILELREVACLYHLLKPGESFFDIGANQGAWGLILAGKGVACHEFEPSSETFQSLQRQIDIQSPDVRSLLHAHQCAISDYDGEASFTVGLGQANHLASAEATSPMINRTETVTMAKLDTIAEEYGIPTAIKIDTEGFTNEVLRGGASVLASPRLRAIAIETFRFADGLTERHLEVEAILEKSGFLPFDYNPAERKLSRLSDPLEGRQDTLYLRGDKHDLSRIAGAQCLTVLGDRY